VRGADTGCRQLGLDGGQRNQNCTVAPIYSALDWFPFRRRDRCHSLVLFPFGFKDFRGTSSAVSDVVTPTGNEGETASTASTLSPLHPHGIPHDPSPPTPTQSPSTWPHLPRRQPLDLFSLPMPRRRRSKAQRAAARRAHEEGPEFPEVVSTASWGPDELGFNIAATCEQVAAAFGYSGPGEMTLGACLSPALASALSGAASRVPASHPALSVIFNAVTVK